MKKVIFSLLMLSPVGLFAADVDIIPTGGKNQFGMDVFQVTYYRKVMTRDGSFVLVKDATKMQTKEELINQNSILDTTKALNAEVASGMDASITSNLQPVHIIDGAVSVETPVVQVQP